MRLFDFIKGVGEKIGIGGGDEAPDAEALKAEVEKHGLDVEGLDIKVDGDKVTVAGNAMTNEMREKVVLAVGNVEGVAQVEETIEVKEGDAEAAFYTVEKGDTLWKISETHYGKGNGGKYNVIFEANKPMLSHPDKIYPGQVLRIPPLEA
ncbi:MAG: peptidoglycan-binding protein LysM [Pseudomonadota bacterium]